MQADSSKGSTTSIRQKAREILSKPFSQKWSAGSSQAVLREMGYSGFLLGMTPVFRKYLNEENPSFLKNNIIGPSLTGMGASLVTQPFDTLKTKLHENHYQGIKETVRDIVKRDKVKLFNGLQGRMPCVMLGSVVFWNATDLLHSITEKIKD